MAIVMTAQWVERVREVELDRRDYFDSKLPGLGLRVSRTGKKIWFVQYRVRGDDKRRRMTLGPFPVIGLSEARLQAGEVLAQAQRGDDPAGAKQDEKKALTLADVAAEYIEKHAKEKKRSWEEDERRLAQFILPAIGKRKIHEVTRAEIYALLDDIKNRRLKAQKNVARHAEAKTAPIQANRCLALVKTVLNFAVDRGYIAMTPAFRMKPPGAARSCERFLSVDEIRAVWTAFDTLAPMMAAMFKLRLLTAQRGAEVEAMKWVDLDLAEAVWTIPAADAKNKRSHRVPLSTPALGLVHELRTAASDPVWVFPSPTRRGQHVTNVQKAAKRVVAASGVAFTLHDLRRTAATHMRRIKIDRDSVSRVLNHVKGDVTAVYDRHSYDDEKRDALERWAACVMGIVNATQVCNPYAFPVAADSTGGLE